MGQTLSPEINLGFELRSPPSANQRETPKTRNGAPRIRSQNAACVQRMMSADLTSKSVAEESKGDSTLKIRRDALVARFNLLQDAHTKPVLMPLEEAMQWRDLVVELKACLYNEHSSCSSHDTMGTIVASAFDTVIPMLVERIPRKDLRPGATMHLQRLLHRCFWSGAMLQPQSTLRFMPLVPCDFPDARNVVAVHCALRRAVPYQRIESDLPKSAAALVRIKETAGECLLANDEFDPRNLLPEHFVVAPAPPERETVILSDTQIRPRAGVLGWIARVYVYLVDKYGRDAVSRHFITDQQAIDWVALTRSNQELYFEQLAAHLTGDYNPFVLLSRPDRVKYARAVLLERKTSALPSSPMLGKKKEESDFEWTVTSMYQSEVVEVVNHRTGETKIIALGDPTVDPSILESIEAFTENDGDTLGDDEEDEYVSS